jgi:hypothetical protein
MRNYFAQWGADGVVFSVVESSEIISGVNVVECAGYDVLGKKWDGENFVDVPKVLRYKVWDKPQFIFMLGKNVLAAINSGANDDLAFYKYILENSPHVDLNVFEFREMVTELNVGGLIDEAKLAELLVQE